MRMILIISLAAVAVGCGGDEGSGEGNGRRVVAGFYPLAYAAERIGGDAIEVTNLTPPGAEPHDVELSARDVERVRTADVVLYLGSGFQPALEDAARDTEGEAVDLLEEVELRPDDPHVWLDPLLYAELAEEIGRVLDRPSDDFVDELRVLNREFEQGLESCESKEIVTSHDAFGYLAERYGLEQIAITGFAPEAEPSPQKLEDVIAEVRESRATTVFFETLVSPELAETVARETEATTSVLNPLEGLTEAELAEGEDYFSVMNTNLHALRQALRCR
jgi:zinc transport system substrate-binding protein